jgi:hypothetical protein
VGASLLTANLIDGSHATLSEFVFKIIDIPHVDSIAMPSSSRLTSPNGGGAVEIGDSSFLACLVAHLSLRYLQGYPFGLFLVRVDTKSKQRRYEGDYDALLQLV